MKLILYTSKTGFTARYAQALSERTGVPARPLSQAGDLRGCDAVYLGWLRAGSIVGFSRALRRCRIAAVCAVGLSCDDVQRKRLEERYHLAQTALFLLPGGFVPDRVKGLDGLMMRMVCSAITSAQKKGEQKEGDSQMLQAVVQGADFCDMTLLDPVAELPFFREESK